jgi:glycyl-tRNA synthetase
MVDCKECKTRFRADHLIEDHTNLNPAPMSFEEMSEVINDNFETCPHCGAKANFTDVRAFDLMFKTSNSKTGEEDKDIYLRPETAQGVFINFKNVVDTMGAKVPFGIGQVGKAFRNEVTPGNFIFRTKEFEQLELEFFTSPEE